MFNIRKSLLCISAISCMSLYADTIYVNKDIIIGDTTKDKDNLGISVLSDSTDCNYWSKEEDNTYVLNNNNDTSWIAKNTVTINKGYTLKLITGYTDNYYYLVLDCCNTFTNNGNVIIDNYGRLDLDNTSTNNGTIDINNGILLLYDSAILNNTGTIILKDSSNIDIDISTLTNKGTIDISNITDLSYWGNDGTFTLEGGSTFILPKIKPTNKRGSIYTFNPITLNGTPSNKVNIVIPEGCEYITDINNNNKKLFEEIQKATGFTFGDDNRDYVEFKQQTDDECENSYVDEC